MRATIARVRRGGDAFVGPEATRTNDVLTAALAGLGTVVAPLIARRRGSNGLDALLAGSLAGDLWVVPTSTTPGGAPGGTSGCSPSVGVGGLVLDGALGPTRTAPWLAWTYYPKLLLGHAGAVLWRDDDLDVTDHGSTVRGLEASYGWRRRRG